MRITSIPQVYRHINRWREMLAVLSRYGLANWASRVDLAFAKDFFKDADGEVLARQTPERRIRMALNELGPTFIKLGQILSTRPDLMGLELTAELQCLQDEARADPPEVVRTMIEKELGRPICDVFDAFDDVPLASASIGQVHAARLKTGESVVVKVQHPGIEEKIRVDLDIITGLATLAERIPEFECYRPRSTVSEFQRLLKRELDFCREARNMTQFLEDFADDARIRIPRPILEYCTGRVLTMERLEGVKLNQLTDGNGAGLHRPELARTGADLYLKMIFNNGLYHADPHPGNIVLLPGDVFGLMDFGMVGRIDERLREDIEEMLLALGNRDSTHLTAIITRIGAAPPDLDQAALSVEVSDFVAHYASQKLDEFDLSGALNEMIAMIRRFRITLPSPIAMLIKVLVMLEGTAQRLSPQFSLMEVLQPYQRRMIYRRLSPSRQLRRLSRVAPEYERLVEMLPRGVIDILQQVQSGKFDVHLDHRGLEPSVNRLVLGLLTSALFVGSALMLSHGVPPVVAIPWFGAFSLFGALGGGLSIALGLRLLRAINKSGHLDRRK